MLVSDIYASRFLRAADLRGRTPTVEIVDVSEEVVGQGPDARRRLVVTFKNARKPLVLNKTNALVLADMFGSETDRWRGRSITLSTESVPFQGQMVSAIRIRQLNHPKAQAQAAQTVAPAPDASDANDGGAPPF